MWLRLALKPSLHIGSAWILSVLGFLLLSACSPSDKTEADKLNSISYNYHYRNLDSVVYYTQQAVHPDLHGTDYRDGYAEHQNNLAFVAIAKMDYQLAKTYLDAIPQITDNQVELLICYVQQMRLCQRRSMNREFYEYREKAVRSLKRIDEDRSQLSERQKLRLCYGETEMAIVTSTYYYYVGLERQSSESLLKLNVEEVRRDTAQYLNYLYNIGAGGIITAGSPEQIYHEEKDYLHRCLAIAQRCHYPFFEAQALEALADHDYNLEQAQRALELFSSYGDVYQIAGAHRTLASCYHAIGNEQQALYHLEQALSDSAIYQAPDLVASIREQLSVVYSALDDKPNSDYNRNIYIDLQEETRQDRELEARAGLLDESVHQLNLMIIAVLVAIALLMFLLWLFNHLNRKKQQDHQLDDLLEEKHEAARISQLAVEKLERRLLEQRAKVSLAMSILPLIDRIRHEVSGLSGSQSENTSAKDFKISYIRELTDKINEQNELLTQWIQLRQGELSLRIESFPLQPLFELVNLGRTSFEMKGITLDVKPTEAIVKADRVLTLFMLNTLADNARKFTSQGGRVMISAAEQADYVEVSVQDTGCGMTEEQQAHLFDIKPFNDETYSQSKNTGKTTALKPDKPSLQQASHGFGLSNCKGIIEKYRKMSQLFSVCLLAVESEQGKGSRLYFRLPKGVKRLILLLLTTHFSLFMAPASAQQFMDRAHIFADSAYFSNVNGNYQRTLLFADSCRFYLNQQYLSQHPNGSFLMTARGENSQMPAEIQWLHDSLPINYQIILDIRNESAVAALALHDWALYNYNNKVYTQLFKELSADASLDDYCRQMQQSQQNKRIAVILLIVSLLLIIPAYYMLYYRHRLYSRHRRERMQLDNIEMADDELRRAQLEQAHLHVVNAVLDNCLSTLKHETMYYPSRIRQLVDSGVIESLGEVTQYYRDLYGILCQQAMRQVEQVKLHVAQHEFYGQQVLGDANLLHYLFELLGSSQVQTAPKDESYVKFTVAAEPKSTFDYLLMRQIVRDHGEATHRRGCGITVSQHTTTIILPRYNGTV